MVHTANFQGWVASLTAVANCMGKFLHGLIFLSITFAAFPYLDEDGDCEALNETHVYFY